ncbi:hypothetical protein R3P38DRAFT_3223654 [Favolaschia claudopus]|uniref:Uncharacterized protein n=1 Tax=Favolaschia claudopus TaxID=2862362 RepID=A0AAV9ZX88_9AGAR
MAHRKPSNTSPRLNECDSSGLVPDDKVQTRKFHLRAPGLSLDEKDEVTIATSVISSITWLLERERGDVQLRKYSGTPDHPQYPDKQGATINAFQHLVYLYSKKPLVWPTFKRLEGRIDE